MLRTLAILVVAATAVAGCGGGDDDDPNYVESVTAAGPDTTLPEQGKAADPTPRETARHDPQH